MNGLRFLLFGLAICLASGVKAQFYDSADDIYYYVQTYEEKNDFYFGYMGKIVENGRKKINVEGDEAHVYIFNFDGDKAVELTNSVQTNLGSTVSSVKNNLIKSPTYYEDKVETTDYKLKYLSSSSAGTIYVYKDQYGTRTLTFSSDRNFLTWEYGQIKTGFKRVDKSYFRVGRSRTPSSTLHE